MNNQDRIRLQHIFDSAQEAISFVHGRKRPELSNDRMLVLSLIKCLELIGEAASKVTDETRNDVPELPWQTMIAMRNRLIHVYFDVDLDIVWNTIQEDLPGLVQILESVLR